jgi:glutaredoxin
MRTFMRGFSLIVSLAALAVTTLHAQQMYRWVDKDGKVTYSDTPPPKDAKEVQQKKLGDGGGSDDDTPFSVKTAVARNPVTLFANFCGETCDSARSLLNTRGVPFTDRNPERDPKALDALKAATGGQDVPVLLVGATVIKGFAADQWQAALTAGGYPSTNPNPRSKQPAPPPPAQPASTVAK